MIFMVTLAMRVPYVKKADRTPGKTEGACPASGEHCTDIRARHHTVMVVADSAADAAGYFTSHGTYVVRTEKAVLLAPKSVKHTADLDELESVIIDFMADFGVTGVSFIEDEEEEEEEN